MSGLTVHCLSTQVCILEMYAKHTFLLLNMFQGHVYMDSHCVTVLCFPLVSEYTKSLTTTAGTQTLLNPLQYDKYFEHLQLNVVNNSSNR